MTYISAADLIFCSLGKVTCLLGDFNFNWITILVDTDSIIYYNSRLTIQLKKEAEKLTIHIEA